MVRIAYSLLICSLVFGCTPSPSASSPQEQTQSPSPIPFDSSLAQYQDEIDAFVAADSQAMPPAGAVLFVGSSSIRMWKSLEADMAPIPVINRGFGGSTMRELNYYIEQLVMPYSPEVIVLYEGDNDITAEDVGPADVIAELDWYRQYMEHHLPKAETYFLGVKPSIARQALLPKGQTTNRLIAEFAAKYPTLHYIDIATPLMINDSTIMDDIFIDDNLHLNAKGYGIWTETIKPIVQATLAKQ